MFISGTKGRLRALEVGDWFRVSGREVGRGSSVSAVGFVFLDEVLITGPQGRRWVSCFWTRNWSRTLGIDGGLRILGRSIDHGPSISAVGFVFLDEGLVAGPRGRRWASCFCPKCLSRALGVGGGLPVFGRRVDFGPSRSGMGFVFLDEKLVADLRYRRWASYFWTKC